MATETGPDLDVAREAVEALMDDTCRIVRLSDPADDVLNEGTGELQVPPGTPTTIYDEASVGEGGRSLADPGLTGGRCKIRPGSESQPRMATEGGVTILPRPYTMGIPWDAPEPKMGDIVEMQTSRRDPELPGTQLIVRDVLRGTMLVQRKMIVERRQ